MEVRLFLSVSAETEQGEDVEQGWKTVALFHDAEIGCDAILSYQWMAQSRLNVLTWRDALQLSEPPRWILRSKPTSTTERPSMVARIDTTPHKTEIQGVIHQDKEKEDDLLEKVIAINSILKMQLSLTEEVSPDTGNILTPEPLTDEDLWKAAKLLKELTPKTEVRGMMLIEDEIESPLAEELREEIMRKYKEKVFRDRVWPRPPGGTHGPAKFYIKPGAKPACGRTISLSGERLEAMRDLEADWKLDAKLEPSRGAAAFPIRKKEQQVERSRGL
jgi:hypothetical protein